MKLLGENFLMVALSDFVHIYPNNLDPNICDYLINLFETSSTSNIYCFTDVREASVEASTVHNQILKNTLNIRTEYYEQYCGKIFPDVNSFEKFTILKTSPEEYSEDAEVDIKTYEDSRRFLCFKWYLNDNSGGQTNFLDLTIQPERGKLIVYPPFWMFPHREETPVESPKYTLTTYLHYR